ncbi:MAG TPA: S41 family peptidase, partial [Pyrinomonadaceae bacterium]|nr:S41 family peptidase [Pyrinomonadaceae bacterium]
KTRGEHIFRGQLVVLVDSTTASAAEEFARVIQLEHRGTVIGDRTKGGLMTSRRFFHSIMIGPVVERLYSFYGASITIGDDVMSDGKSLEHVGILPDEVLLPSASDLVARRDPVLSRAAALVGITITPENAGALFPSERKTEVNTSDNQNEEK